ncbi:PREDICTED: pentatricopeptide repeat-containing protein At4g04790, mitochondrial-like isoform X2 [Ipomoea nil]|uniref:pentatricopeptide repeat-containing protein At4g04790, mitochondrial-like isoform X2 n=1 Tax=Ipomoea nil TaxID=35883 RepID=UPI000901C521|nr:PREDICTED: pentatricopeptide repeat-containing protein At4g04790, mitochondrial-like isoform X2 [Ipomoea nil]
MPVSKAKNLASLLRSGAALAKTTAPTASGDIAAKRYVSSVRSSASTASESTQSPSFNSPSKPLIGAFDGCSDDHYNEDQEGLLSQEISSILCGDVDSKVVNPPKSQVISRDKTLENVLGVPCISNIPSSDVSLRRKEVSRERKQKWVLKICQKTRLDRLVELCFNQLGIDATVQVFGKLRRETGLVEYNALIRSCIEKARMMDNEEESLKQLSVAYKFLKSMREQGFQLQEDFYGQVLMYLIDCGMVPEFHFYCELIRDGNADSLPNLAYYEMLLFIKTKNIDKVEELCYNLALYDGKDKDTFLEKYLLAMSSGDCKEQFLQLLNTLDITKVTSMKSLTCIFKSLGKLMLENIAEKCFLDLKTSDVEAEKISSFIFEYTTSVPNLAVEDIVLKFKNLHAEMDVTPSSAQWEKLIKFSCELLKVHIALDIVDQMYEQGLALSIEAFNLILGACEESYEYNLVRRMHSIISCYNLKPNSESFRMMINLSVKMKDFAGAYNLTSDLQKFNLMPTASMYNAIMGGYFREKNIHGGLMVLKQMEDAKVKPDSQTFSYLLRNCNCEDDIIKFYDELTLSGVQVTKHVYMALINAYASCGQFEKAKQVILGKGIPVKNLNEVKSMLVSALAAHGQVSDALEVYEEIKQAKCNLDPRSVSRLIDHLQSEGEFNRLLQLLDELDERNHWIGACFKVISYCVRHEDLRSVIELLKKLKDMYNDDEVAREVLFDEVFYRIAEKEPRTMHFGWNLLQSIKKDIGLRPSRKCLDFLLSACISAKDLPTCFKIWEEYIEAGLPHNSLSYLRMYQALLALGSQKSAKNMLSKISKEDPHVRAVIYASRAAYRNGAPVGGKKNAKADLRPETMNILSKLEANYK